VTVRLHTPGASPEVREELDDPEFEIPIDRSGCDVVYAINPREVKYDPRTIADADGLALYFAEVLRRAMPRLRWDIGKEPKRFRYAHQHKPLLKNEDVDINVIGIAYGMGVRAAIMGTSLEPEALLSVYRAWTEPQSS